MGLELRLLSRDALRHAPPWHRRTFADARAQFAAAWHQILPKLTAAQFDEYRLAVASKAGIRAIRAARSSPAKSPAR
jgi:hypothetical protein